MVITVPPSRPTVNEFRPGDMAYTFCMLKRTTNAHVPSRLADGPHQSPDSSVMTPQRFVGTDRHVVLSLRSWVGLRMPGA